MFFAKFRSHRVEKRESYDEKFVIAQRAYINDGATSRPSKNIDVVSQKAVSKHLQSNKFLETKLLKVCQ